MNRRAARALPAVALVLALGGCGGSSSDSPADRVPALQARLDAVDSAVAAHDYAAARTAVNRLVRTAFASERSGDLDHADAAAIASAAQGLVAAMPRQQAPSSPATSSTPSPSPTPEHTKAPPPPKPPKPPKHDKPPKGPGHDHGHGHGH